MQHIDKIYISRLGAKLERFTEKRSNLFNCKCPLCGDSKKKSYKARGFIYIRKSNFNYMCHNCGASMSLSAFMKQIDPELHKEYVLEKWKSGQTGSRKNIATPEFKFDAPTFTKSKVCDFNLGTKVVDLPDNHPAKIYCIERKIPKLDLLYYTNKFKSLVSELTDGYDNLIEEERLVIPFFDSDCSVFALQGRALKQSGMRYITIKIDEEKTKIYGLERLDPTKTSYVVEGPLDSLFLENSVAMAGADVDLQYFSEWKDVVFILDNEPRNKQIVDKYVKLIDAGFKVTVWPEKVKEKDLNDIILSGIDTSELKQIISKNTTYGLQAKLRVNNWKRC